MDISDLPDHPDCDPAADPDWDGGTYSPDTLVLDDQVSLLRTWRHLVGAHDAHRRHGLWLLLIDEDDHPMAGVLEVEGCVDLPEPDQLDSMVARPCCVPGRARTPSTLRTAGSPRACSPPAGAEVSRPTWCTSRPRTGSSRCRPTTCR